MIMRSQTAPKDEIATVVEPFMPTLLTLLQHILASTDPASVDSGLKIASVKILMWYVNDHFRLANVFASLSFPPMLIPTASVRISEKQPWARLLVIIFLPLSAAVGLA